LINKKYNIIVKKHIKINQSDIGEKTFRPITVSIQLYSILTTDLNPLSSRLYFIFVFQFF